MLVHDLLVEYIENVIVNSPKLEEGDAALLFGSQPVHYTDVTTFEDLLVGETPRGIFATHGRQAQSPVFKPFFSRY